MSHSTGYRTAMSPYYRCLRLSLASGVRRQASGVGGRCGGLRAPSEVPCPNPKPQPLVCTGITMQEK